MHLLLLLQPITDKKIHFHMAAPHLENLESLENLDDSENRGAWITWNTRRIWRTWGKRI